MRVCWATLFSNGLVGFTCEQAHLSNLRGRAYRPNGKGMGEEEVLSDVVPKKLFLLPGFRVGVSLNV